MDLKYKVGSSLGTAVAGIIAAVFFMEGGYVNDPKDPGGETNHGITIAVAKAHGYKGTMKDLPKDMAYEIYLKDYIEKPNFIKVIELSPNVGEKLVDAGVNIGTTKPSKWFQESLNSVNRGGKDYPNVAVDGKIGTGTLNAYSALQRVRGKVMACELMLKLLDAHQTAHYIGLTNLNTFTVGWVSHRIGNVPVSRCKNEK